MAKATKNTRKVETVQYVPNGVTLELTNEEARVLVIILSKVGGHPGDTLRGYQSRISDALAAGGYNFNSKDMDAITGNLVFTYEKLGLSPTEPPSSYKTTLDAWSR